MILHGIYFLTNKSTWREKPKFSKCEQILCQHQLAKAKLKTKTNNPTYFCPPLLFFLFKIEF